MFSLGHKPTGASRDLPRFCVCPLDFPAWPSKRELCGHQVIDDDITPKLEKLGMDRSKYLEYSSLNNELEGLRRLCTAWEFVCAEQAKQKCIDAQADDAARRDELTGLVKTAETKMAQLKTQIIDVLARKETEGAGELKALEQKEQVRAIAPHRSTPHRSQAPIDQFAVVASPPAVTACRHAGAVDGTYQARLGAQAAARGSGGGGGGYGIVLAADC